MNSRAYWRVTDMRTAISEIRKLLNGKDVNALVSDAATRAAYERFLEILSEASRHVPAELKEEFSHVPWRQVADLGNFIRHAYHKIDIEALWSIYENDLDNIDDVVGKLADRLRPR
jgi:uncharacterized protein with HEPN domain